MIGVSIVFSILMAYVSWGQGLSYAVSVVPYSLWFVFFYLLHKEYPIESIEKIVLIYGILYIILYIFQFINSDAVYFGFRETFKEDRGIIRIDFPGGGIFFLSYFICLIKSSTASRGRPIFLLFVLVGVAVTVLQVTRQSIALILIISLFHFIRKASIPRKIAILASFSALLFYFFTADNPISQGLIEKQNETLSEGDEYIRILAADYFISDFSPNAISRIFGNGFPNNTSEYGKYTIHLADSYGFYLSDLGLIGFYVLFGLAPLIAYLIIFIKSFTIKVPEQYYYIKYYMFFILGTCLTSDYAYSINYLFTNIFVLYCFQMIHQQNQQKILISNPLK
jgi:hypothetical protein